MISKLKLTRTTLRIDNLISILVDRQPAPVYCNVIMGLLRDVAAKWHLTLSSGYGSLAGCTINVKKIFKNKKKRLQTLN